MSSIDHSFDNAETLGSTSDGEDGATGQATTLRDGWFARLSIVRKLQLAVFGNTIVLAVITVLMLGGTWYFSEEGEEQAAMSFVEVRTGNSAIIMVDAVAALQRAESATSPEEQNRAIAEAGVVLALLDDILSDPAVFGDEIMPAAVKPQVDGFRRSLAQLRGDIAVFEGSAQELAAIRNQAASLYDAISDFSLAYHDEVATNARDLFDDIAFFFLFFVALTVGGVVVSLLGARTTVRDVSGMIGTITDSMQGLAGGDTAATIPGTDRHDEIGAMARALTVFRQSSLELRDLTDARAREAEEQLAHQQLLSQQMRELRLEKSQLLEGLADGFEVSVGDLITAVSAASEQLRATSKQMVALADGSNEQAQDATEAMERATANVTAAAAATDEFALSISEISKQASASAELARGASELVSNANRRMGDLSGAALEIGEIVELIQTIAHRTNLLALNASIEAARGGEAGRGFAVVASEVKELAMQTSNATSSITERITAMQDSTQSSAADLTTIVGRISELEQAAVTIASAVDQQSVSGEELARNIDTVATGSKQVAERLQSLHQASEETGQAADDVVSSADALGEHAEELRNKAGRFIADVRRSARELEAGTQPA